VKRAWCLFELFTATQRHGEVEITIVLPPTEREGFEAAMSGDGYRRLEVVLNGIDSAGARASVPADLEAIRQHVQTLPGGFEALDTAVRLHLQGWFAEQGAVLSAPRIRSSLTMKNDEPSRVSCHSEQTPVSSPPPFDNMLGDVSIIDIEEESRWHQVAPHYPEIAPKVFESEL